MIYTVYNTQGGLIDSGLALEQAADAMLTVDGYDYTIIAPHAPVPDNSQAEGSHPHLYRLYVTRHSVNNMGGNGGYAEWPDYAASSESGVRDSIITLGGVHGTYAEAGHE